MGEGVSCHFGMKIMIFPYSLNLWESGSWTNVLFDKRRRFRESVLAILKRTGEHSVTSKGSQGYTYKAFVRWNFKTVYLGCN